MIDEDTKLTTESDALAQAINKKSITRTTVDNWWMHAIKAGHHFLIATERKTERRITVRIEAFDLKLMVAHAGGVAYALGEPAKSYNPA